MASTKRSRSPRSIRARARRSLSASPSIQQPPYSRHLHTHTHTLIMQNANVFFFLVFNERTVHFWRSVAAFPRCASPKTRCTLIVCTWVSFMIIYLCVKKKGLCYQLIIVSAGEESEPYSRRKNEGSIRRASFQYIKKEKKSCQSSSKR